MLTVRFDNLADAAAIYEGLGFDEEPSGANFVMYDEASPVALWRMKMSREEGSVVGVIDNIIFKESVDEEDKTFFLHAMLFKLLEGAPIRLRAIGEREELKKFGFEFVGGNTEINSTDINLHYGCAARAHLHKQQD